MVLKGRDNMEKIIMRLFKKAEKTQGKMVIPKAILNKLGYEFYMEIYEDYIKLIPVGKEK